MKNIICKLVLLCLCLSAYYQTVYGADKTYLRNTIVNYFSNIRHELVNSTEKQRVRNFIQDQFQSFGLDTYLHLFNVAGGQEETYYNIIGVLKGTRFGEATDKIIGVGAHYDTVKTSPGVDDNGSGMAAMLETARTISQQNKDGVTRKNTIIFAAFDLEETDIYGSAVFVADWLNKFLYVNYPTSYKQLSPHGVIILDTIMEYNDTQFSQMTPGSEESLMTYFPEAAQSIAADNLTGDFIATIYQSTSVEDTNLAVKFYNQWNLQGRDEMEIELFGLPNLRTDDLPRMFRSFLLSDHFNFWKNGIPAIFITDSAFYRGDMQMCYHQLCDNVEVILTDENVNFLDKITDTVIATVDNLSDRDDTKDSGSHTQSFLLLTFMSLLAALTLH